MKASFRQGSIEWLLGWLSGDVIREPTLPAWCKAAIIGTGIIAVMIVMIVRIRSGSTQM